MRAARLLRLVALLGFAACQSGPPVPVALPLDKAHCARCGMLVSEEKSGAQMVFSRRDPLFYDDLGCLFADEQALQGGGIPYVQVEGKGWVHAQTAFYARPPGVRTPMNYGFVAFNTESAARASDAHGAARRWPEVLAVSAPGGGS